MKAASCLAYSCSTSERCNSIHGHSVSQGYTRKVPTAIVPASKAGFEAQLAEEAAAHIAMQLKQQQSQNMYQSNR